MFNVFWVSLSIIGWVVAASLAALSLAAVFNLTRRGEENNGEGAVCSHCEQPTVDLR